MIKLSRRTVKQLSDNTVNIKPEIINHLSKNHSTINFCDLPLLDSDNRKTHNQLVDNSLLNTKAFEFKYVSPSGSKKIKLSSFDLPNFKHSTLGFTLDSEKKDNKSRNPNQQDTQDKETRYDRRARRASLVFPELTAKIKSLYNLKMNVDMKLGKVKSNFKQLETKYNKIEKDEKMKHYDFICSPKFKEVTSLSKIKNIFYQATRNKQNKQFFLSNHAEPKPLAFCFSNEKKEFPRIEKYLQYEKKKKKIKIPNYLKNKMSNLHNSFEKSFSNLGDTTIKPIFYKNVLNCCENLKNDNNNFKNDILNIKSIYYKK